jgi:hypothetical protein
MAASLRWRVAVMTGAGRCQGIGAAIRKALPKRARTSFYPVGAELTIHSGDLRHR